MPKVSVERKASMRYYIAIEFLSHLIALYIRKTSSEK